VPKPVEDSPSPEEQQSPAPAVAAGSDQLRILVVDDEPVNRKVLDNHLTGAGYEVVQAVDGPQALEIMGSGEKFDLILLDIMMPKMSGYEVCHRLREMFLPSELPVVMLTAKNRVSDLVEGFSVGANDYLTKPFSRDELLSRIKTHLSLHGIYRVTGKFVPHAFIRTLGKDAITEVRLGDYTEQVVTVFFSDIRDYTALSETMTPEENFKFVNAYAGRMGPIIREHQGFINQYLGDGIMAIFPKKLDHALQSAIDMQRAVAEYNVYRNDRQRKPISVGMGIHTGSLVMGIIGDEERNDPSTIADTVNAASRMESLTKHYGANIIVSEASKTTLQRQDFHLRYLGQVQVKGKQKVIRAYECFDGDDPVIKDLKQGHIGIFEEGMEAYLAREFAQSTALFDQVLQSNPDDQVAYYFRNRAARYLLDGVADDWDGVEKLTSK
jgi:class 3 adenylate cyclase/ActR/RegA family two-component response regulator